MIPNTESDTSHQNYYFFSSRAARSLVRCPVIMANGAWRDRNIGIDGADEYIGKGLIYQNPFIYWYNHKNEKTYNGPRYEVPDEALVLGGGLASIDVVKILQMENYERALKARGIEAHMHDFEKKGIPAVCKAHGIDPASLGIKGCLLVYRRRQQDMPLAQPPENATPEQLAKQTVSHTGRFLAPLLERGNRATR